MSNHRLKLLIVEDDLLVLEMVRTVLISLDAEVCAVPDAREAVKRVANESFDGIFVDLNMPWIDGIRLTEHIRASAENARKPVVVITARTDVAAMKRAYAAGATFLLHKPLTQMKISRLMRVVAGSMRVPAPDPVLAAARRSAQPEPRPRPFADVLAALRG